MSMSTASRDGRRLAVRLVVYGAAALVPCGILVGFLAREYTDARRLEQLARARHTAHQRAGGDGGGGA